MQNTYSLRAALRSIEEELLRTRHRDIYRVTIDAVEKELIETILERTFGNQIKAAKLLGINRNTLRSKIRKFGITIDSWKL